MDSVTIRDFRCFRGEQTARMAPLTLLVGENSTGKTSFLALIRALLEAAVFEAVPDFRRPPYDLGAFSEIVYNDSSRSDQPDAFQAGFRDSIPENSNEIVSLRFTFQDVDGVTFPVSRYVSVGDTSFEAVTLPGQGEELRLGIGKRFWKVDSEVDRFRSRSEWLHPIGTAVKGALHIIDENVLQGSIQETSEQYEELSPDEDDIGRIRSSHQKLATWQFDRMLDLGADSARLFAGAPIRSKPRRTYDPSRLIPDPEGEYVPSYLANMSRRDSDEWGNLKKGLVKFGRSSGMFDEISVESFGKTDAAPFQIHIRKFGKELKGLHRNLIDVGYGVSQTLQIVTELLRTDAPSVFLLQQPEVHLHPRAQAALGSLFCSIAGQDRQLVVETHSDYIIDRVRMDVRDKKTDLKPDEVSILYFERGESDVKIHSIRLDQHGNVLNAPEGYRQFFADELTRSIGL